MSQIDRQDRLVPLSEIKLDEESRVRQKYPFEDMAELTSSIGHHIKIGLPAGLKQPIALDENNLIIAGARRYKALKQIMKGADIDVPCTIFIGLSENEKKLFEVGENVIRADFDSIDLAIGLKKLADEMNFKLTEEAVEAFANLIKLPKNKIRDALRVGKFLERATPDQIQEAKGRAGTNATPKEMVSALRKVEKTAGERTQREIQMAVTATIEDKQIVEIHNMDCIDYVTQNMLETQNVKPFNLMMMDPPYGINLSTNTFRDAHYQKGYDDSPDVYFKLVKFFAENIEKILDPNGVLLLWFSMHHYCWTMEMFGKMPDVRIRKTPMGWFRVRGSNTGDQSLDPMPSWEPCLFICRGKPSVYGENFTDMFSEQSNKLDHISEKPIGALTKWFERWGVPGGSFFDPTCGSGISLQVARQRGMKRVIGCEIDPEFHRRAQETLQRIEAISDQQAEQAKKFIGRGMAHKQQSGGFAHTAKNR